MPVRKCLITAALFLIVSAATPSKASAEWWFTPFIGANWGGSATFDDAGFEFEDEFERRLNYGAGLAYLGGGIVGFEVEFSYSPNFFETTTEGFEFTNDSNVTTFMGNVIVAGRSGTIRPYATGGIGLIRSQINNAEDFFDDVSTSDFGFNVGGGVGGFFSDKVGVRGDIRYFRSLQDHEPDGEFDLGVGSFRFWRGYAGLIFRF